MDATYIETISRLKNAFPKSFINSHNEFIAECTGRTNEWFALDGCETGEHIECKVLEWLSRGACKTEPYYTDRSNKAFHKRMLSGINGALGTDFSEEDMLVIYTKLGNCVNHALTLDFVRSGYNLMVLDKEQEEPELI